MKKTLLSIAISILLSLNGRVQAQQVIISDDASYASPASGAMLDVKSTNKGFLPPRVTLTGTADATTIASPTTGLMVYNSATAGSSPTNVTPGYYYNSGTTSAPKWSKVMSADVVNGMTIQDDGSPILNGTATVFNDIVVPPFSTYLSGSNSPTFVALVGGVQTFTFGDAATDQSVYFSVQMPHNWKEGSPVYPHIHWSPQTNNKNGNVIWGLEYSWAEYNSATPVVFPTTAIIYATTAAITGSSDADKHFLTAFANITPNSTQDNISSILMCRLFRNSSSGSDTYNGSAALLSFDFHYEIDAIGSRSEYTK